jgi:putative peptidoglycan lipid II flippase
MIAVAPALVDLVLRGGRFTAADSVQTAAYFALFSVSLFLWSAQSIYARAFYAAGNTLTPMLAGTLITVISLPVYAGLYRWEGPAGLAIASDLGITLQTVALAVLLHRRRMVSLASVDYAELGRCLAAGAVSGGLVWAMMAAVHRFLPETTRWLDAAELAVGSLVWLTACGWLLDRLGSALPRAMMKKLGLR